MYTCEVLKHTPDIHWILVFSQRATAGHQPGHGGREAARGKYHTNEMKTSYANSQDHTCMILFLKVIRGMWNSSATLVTEGFHIQASMWSCKHILQHIKAGNFGKIWKHCQITHKYSSLEQIPHVHTRHGSCTADAHMHDDWSLACTLEWHY